MVAAMSLLVHRRQASYHGLHLWALQGGEGLAPAYARQDRRLRRTAKLPAPETEGFEPARLWEDDVALADEAWFERRWEGGEREASEGAAEVLVQAMDGAVFGDRAVEVGVSNAAGPLGVAWARPWVGLFAPGCPPAVATLALLAASLEAVMPLEGMAAHEAHGLRVHVAATAWIGRPEVQGGLDAHLAALTPVLCAPVGHPDAFSARFGRWAARLDQAPGEIGRIHDGMVARRSDRMHRAWMRGFFVPAGVDLAAWRRSLGWPEDGS